MAEGDPPHCGGPLFFCVCPDGEEKTKIAGWVPGIRVAGEVCVQSGKRGRGCAGFFWI